jgi:3-methylfumaryl-CoA hydratase
MTTNRAGDEVDLTTWIGRTESTRDVVAPTPVAAMHATLDYPVEAIPSGTALPPLWHWLYFWTIAPRSGLGRDGHPALGGFLPPVGTARRMWAGSRVRWPGRLLLGEEAQRTSTILDVVPKSGRTGRLVFVTVRHEISGSGGLAIVDEHDIVYREDAGAGTSARAGEPAPVGATYSRRMEADTTTLFRYSALTFNGHRIHYDREYATRIEGYAGLVVHGPLLATLMADLAVRARPDRPIAEFEFRGHRPVIDTDPFTVCGTARGDVAIDLWVANHQGVVAMKGTAVFR